MNLNTELKNHILCEFSLHKNLHPFLITETRGVVDGMDDIVNVFIRMVKPQVNDLFSTGKPTTIYYDETTDEFYYSGLKTFFDSFRLYLTLSIGEKSYEGGVNSDCIIKVRGKYRCNPKILLSISARNSIEMLNMLSFTLAHELTHAYNLLQYAIKNNSNGKDNLLNRNKYKNIQDALHTNVNINNLKATGSILYNLSRIERNVYIAQLRQELLANKNMIKDTKTAFNLIKQTESYKKFLNLEKNVNIINNNNLDPRIQNELMNYLNSIMDKKFTNFEQVKKYYNRRWQKWKKAYLVRASKIVYDIFDENNKWLIDNSGNDNTLISQKDD